MSKYGIVNPDGTWVTQHNGDVWTGDLETAVITWVDLMVDTGAMGLKVKPIEP